MTSLFFRHDIYIDDMCISDMTSALMTWCRCHVWNTHIINIDVMSEKKPDVMNVDVMSEKHWYHEYRCHVKIYWCHRCRCHVWKTMMMTFTFMTSVFFRYVSNSYDTSVFRHDIYIQDISVFFRHDIYIDDISVFFSWHLHSGMRVFPTWQQHL
jgi:hypothetical protein